MTEEFKARLERIEPVSDLPVIASFHALERYLGRRFAAVTIGFISNMFYVYFKHCPAPILLLSGLIYMFFHFGISTVLVLAFKATSSLETPRQIKSTFISYWLLPNSVTLKFSG